MELTTLVEPDIAKARLKEYEEMRAEERTREDQAIAAGYRAAARGLPVISLPEVIRAGGRFEQSKRPKLAIVSADATVVRVDSVGGGHDVVYSSDPPRPGYWWDKNPIARTSIVGRNHVRVNNFTETSEYFSSAQTIVPMIPPQHRPKRNRLHLFHILWEVEKWDPTPPIDPALLKHIGGDLWAVHAVWALTELERAVLSQRA